MIGKKVLWPNSYHIRSKLTVFLKFLTFSFKNKYINWAGFLNADSDAIVYG